MNRRLFIKAMGFSGAMSLANWRTLATGPTPGCAVYHGWIHKRESRVWMAGEHLPAAHLVTIKDGKAYLCRSSDNPSGVTIHCVKPGEEFEAVVSGSVTIRTGDRK